MMTNTQDITIKIKEPSPLEVYHNLKDLETTLYNWLINTPIYHQEWNKHYDTWENLNEQLDNFRF